MKSLSELIGHEVTLSFAIGHEIRDVTLQLRTVESEWVTGMGVEEAINKPKAAAEFALLLGSIELVRHPLKTCVACRLKSERASAA